MISPRRHPRFSRFCCFFSIFSFLLNLFLPASLVFAQTAPVIAEMPGMVSDPAMLPPTVLEGLTVDPLRPFHFDFIINNGGYTPEDNGYIKEVRKLIRYFLASLTIPEQDLWVNLSPYEKDRVVSKNLGATEMGGVLLAQDYVLKHLTASLTYPESASGRKFWDNLYARMKKDYGITEFPVDVFNKVWIVPDKVQIVEKDNTVFIVNGRLKVLSQQDYWAQKSAEESIEKAETSGAIGTVSADLVREILIPEIEKEVNEGDQFASLRQIYHSLILAAWYKRNLKASLLNQVYADQNKTKGLKAADQHFAQKLYTQYIDLFKKGVFNLIREDIDMATGELVPRRYFSGGSSFAGIEQALEDVSPEKAGEKAASEDLAMASVDLTPERRIEDRDDVKNINWRMSMIMALKWTLQSIRSEGLLITETMSAQLFGFLDRCRALESPARQLILVSLLSNDIETVDVQGKIFFKGVRGVWINKNGELIVDPDLLDAVGVLIEGQIAFDIDANLAPREDPFSDEMASTIQSLGFSGGLIPIMSTDNDIKKGKKRFDVFTKEVRAKIRMGANGSGAMFFYDTKTDETHWEKDLKYSKDMKAYIPDEIIAIIEQSNEQLIQNWGVFQVAMARLLGAYLAVKKTMPLYNRIADKDGTLRLLTPEETDKIEPLNQGIVKFLNELDRAMKDRVVKRDLRDELSGNMEYVNMNRDALDAVAKKILENPQADVFDLVNRIREILEMPHEKEADKEQRIEQMLALSDKISHDQQKMYAFHYTVAVMEILHLLTAQQGDPGISKQDLGDKKDLWTKYLVLDEDNLPASDGVLRLENRDNVQLGLKPIRPRLIRDLNAKILKREQQELLDDAGIRMYPGGSTTVNYTPNHLGKHLVVRFIHQESDSPVELMFFSGDEMAPGSPDSKVPLDPELKGIMAIDTADAPAARIKGVPLASTLSSKKIGLEKGLTGPAFNLKILQWIEKRLDEDTLDLLTGKKKPEDTTPIMAELRQELGFEPFTFGMEDYIELEAQRLIKDLNSFQSTGALRSMLKTELRFRTQRPGSLIQRIHHVYQRLKTINTKNALVLQKEIQRLTEPVIMLDKPVAANDVSTEAIMASQEHKVINERLQRLLDFPDEMANVPHLYSYLWTHAENALQDDFNPDMADHVIVRLKKEFTSGALKEYTEHPQIDIASLKKNHAVESTTNTENRVLFLTAGQTREVPNGTFLMSIDGIIRQVNATTKKMFAPDSMGENDRTDWGYWLERELSVAEKKAFSSTAKDDIPALKKDSAKDDTSHITGDRILFLTAKQTKEIPDGTFLMSIDGVVKEVNTMTRQLYTPTALQENDPTDWGYLLCPNKKRTDTRQTILDALFRQAAEYTELVNGFGTIHYDAGESPLRGDSREEGHENAFFRSQQAIDTLGEWGMDETVLERIQQIADTGFNAHRPAVHLRQMEDDLNKAINQGKQELAVELSMKLSTYKQAVRRWLALQTMLIKAIARIGLQSGSDSQVYQKAADYLIRILKDNESTGEGYYWVRYQAAIWLGYFTDSDDALDALKKEKDFARSPHPDTVFMDSSMEAANAESLSLAFPAGMAYTNIIRNRAKREVILDPQNFDYTQTLDRFARLTGVYDVLLDSAVEEATRVKVLDVLAGLTDEPTALASNFMLDALEEMVLQPQEPEIFFSPEQTAMIKSQDLQRAAASAFLRIAQSVAALLPEESAASKQISSHIDKVQSATPFDPKSFQELTVQVHAILGNMHRLDQLRDLNTAGLHFDQKIVLGSNSQSEIWKMIANERALVLSGNRDDGGATLMERAFAVSSEGIYQGGFGDQVTIMIKMMLAQGVPGARQIEKLLATRFKSDSKSLREELKRRYPALQKEATAAGEADKKHFEEFFADAMRIADIVDKTGKKTAHNAVKNLLMTGIKHYTSGIGQDLMNPDGIYAAFEYFRQMLGISSIAVPPSPIGEFFALENAAGALFFGQSYFSHVPRVYNGRPRSVYSDPMMVNAYADIPVKSRIADVVREAKIVSFGMGSPVTTIGTLMDDRPFVRALAKNPSKDKFFISNPVRDLETKDMKIGDVGLQDKIIHRKNPDLGLENVLTKIITPDFPDEDLSRPVLAARPGWGTLGQILSGENGSGYTGANMMSPDEVAAWEAKGMTVWKIPGLVQVLFLKKRTRPSERIPQVVYNPIKMVVELRDKIDKQTEQTIKPGSDIEIFRLIPNITRLLHQEGLSVLDLGIRDFDDLFLRPQLAKELSSWVTDGRRPEWLLEKEDGETPFQSVVRHAVGDLDAEFGFEVADFRDIRIGNAFKIGTLNGGRDLLIKISSQEETDRAFMDRISILDSLSTVAEDDQELIEKRDLKTEIFNRIGKIRYFPNDHKMVIQLPNEVVDFGKTPRERANLLNAILQFQIEKAALMAEKDFQQEGDAHYTAMKKMESSGKKSLLGEAACAIELMHFLRKTQKDGLIPHLILSIQGAVANPDDPLSMVMMSDLAVLLANRGIRVTLKTGLPFDEVYNQILSPAKDYMARRQMSLSRRGETAKDQSLFENLSLSVASGGVLFQWVPEEENYKTDAAHTAPISPSDRLLYELAARLTMPILDFPVTGPRIENREPLIPQGEEGELQHASLSIIQPGKYFANPNDYDPGRLKRGYQAYLISILLKDPEKMLKSAANLVNNSDGEWKFSIQNSRGEDIFINVDPREHEKIRTLLQKMAVLQKQDADVFKKKMEKIVQISSRTTIDILQKIILDVDPQERIALVGDQINLTRLRSPEGYPFEVRGKDYRIFQELQNKIPSPLALALYTGSIGSNDSIPKAVTAIGETISPAHFDSILAASSQSILKGPAVHRIQTDSDKFMQTLQEKNVDLSAFGIDSLSSLNERQAWQILNTLDISEDQAITTEIQQNGGIDLHFDFIDWEIKRDASGIPLPLPQQLPAIMNIDGLYFTINGISIPDVPMLLGLRKKQYN